MSGCGPGGRTSGPEKYPPATRHAHRLVSPPPTAQGCLAKGSARRRVVETYEISATSKRASKGGPFQRVGLIQIFLIPHLGKLNSTWPNSAVADRLCAFWPTPDRNRPELARSRSSGKDSESFGAFPCQPYPEFRRVFAGQK